MRIIAGTKKGMNLFSPKTDISRPITDRVKEALFNVLASSDLLAGKSVADLFSGVGSMGIESLSRGASSALFVEKDFGIVSILKKNIAKAGFAEKSKVIRADAFKVGAPVDIQQHDLVFIDPPYRLTMNVGINSPLAGLLDILSGQMTPSGIAVVRTEVPASLLDQYGKFCIIDRRQWGKMNVAFLGKSRENS